MPLIISTVGPEEFAHAGTHSVCSRYKHTDLLEVVGPYIQEYLQMYEK